MTNGKKYNFRDSTELLEKIDKGTRSNFIRESIKLKMNMETQQSSIKLTEIQQLINFYNNIIKDYDTTLNTIENTRKKIIQNKKETQNRLKNTITEQIKIKTIQDTQKQIENNQKREKQRKIVCDEITNNLLEKRDNNKSPQINLEYMKTLGQYKNNKELSEDLTQHIYNLHENENIKDRQIFKEDIEYLENEIKKVT